MPARILERYVNAGIKAGAVKTTPEMIADVVWRIAERGEKVPLRLPLGKVAWTMGKGKFEGLLREWEGLREIALLGEV
jgi:hypothetical protein